MKRVRSVRCGLALMAGLFVAAGTAAASPIVFSLGADPGQDYLGETVGPYSGTLTHSIATGFFCLDQNLASSFNTRYSGTVAAPNTWQEKEAAFLAAVAVHLNHTADGPISFAIWQVMGTATVTDPAAAPWLEMAEFAWQRGLITPGFLQQVLIFTPSDPQIQRFITGIPGCEDVSTVMRALEDSVSETPEPSTFVLGFSALGVAMTTARRRRTRLRI